jgi:Immunity protein 27
MKLEPHETSLVGKWIVEDGQIRRDSTCDRIDWLTTHHLHKIAISKQWGAWETLFQDPDDGRYWEQTYPSGDMHGGGPPALNVLSKEQAKAKYDIE